MPIDFESEYHSTSQTLTVDPTPTLWPEQEIRLILSQGILSEDGIALQPAFLSRRALRAKGEEPRPAAVLTFYTGKH